MTSDYTDIGLVYNNIGHVHRQRHELRLALKHFELACKIRRKLLLSDHLHIAPLLYNIGGIYRCKGDFDRALNYYQQVLDIDKKKLSR